MSKDGAFHLFYKDDYACLTVFPSSDPQDRLYPEDIMGRLNILGIRNVRRQTVLDTIEEASGQPVPIAKWPEGKRLNPEISLSVDDDKMTARLVVKPEKQGGEPLSVGMLRLFLKENNITHGIDTGILESIVLKHIYNQQVKVAFGTPPVDEKASEPEYFFITDRGRPFRELEHHRIDLKELNFIQNRKKGDLLARLNPALPPKDGTDILGGRIAAERGAESPEFGAGEGAVLSEDGRSISAGVDGNARIERGLVIVEPLISVEDIDYSNGNMDFDGSIDISGRVADGFEIKAGGDIQIGKSVSRVRITSGGDIILKTGITGNDEGRIVCEGDLYARYIESANIICTGSVFVEEAIMHSSVKAGGDIILAGKRAEIFGGRLFASGSVKCKKLGSLNEPVTEIFLGLTLDTFTAIEELQKTVSGHTARLNELDTSIRQLKNALKNQESDEIPREKLIKALSQLEHESVTQNIKLSDTLKQLHEMKRSISLNESSELTAEQQIFGNVHVYFNHLRWDSPGKGCGKTRLLINQGKLLEK